ncbi:MAG: TAT-variant-translocated molybdopterin oxidoreductase [Flavipsychrobacter sp.]
MSQKKYWKGLEELQATAAHKEVVDNEFKEELPLDLSDDLLGANTPRRDFLKFLGFSTAAAALAASCEMPVRKVIPYAIKPEEIVPGVPNYYASTFVDGGDYCPVVIKTRDGRPIKLEGNELSSITEGATSARVQASVLNLYDKARLRKPYADGKEATFEAIDRSIKEGLQNNSGEAYILTSTILSPTTKEAVKRFIAAYPNAKHITYDAISYSGMLLANEACYGKRTLPSYHFNKAKTIVGLGADFLGTWLAPVEFTKQYAKGRKVSAANPTMSKHYQVEATHTITGAAADKRATCKPSQMGAVAVALYNAVVNGAAPALASDNLNKLVANAAADLKKGNGLVVCGSNDVHIQTVVNAINDKVGANGTIVNWAVTSNYKQGIDSDMVALTEAMNAGKVGALMMQGVNPVYDYYNSEQFAAGLKKVPVSISFADRMDETASACKYIVPDHNFLESWGDAEPKTGYYSLMQPGIAPLFKTRAFQDSLLTWAGSSESYGDLWKAWWTNKLGGQSNFDKALQDGVVEPAGDMAMGAASFSGNVDAAISNISSRKAVDGVELVVYPKISIGQGGAWSNNPWLQEMPDPITKATWDNYVCVSPERAKNMDAELTSITEVVDKKLVVKVEANGKSVELPIVVVPGMNNDVIAIAVGYGRSEGVGMAARSGVDKFGDEIGGKNAYPFVAYNGTTFDYASKATIEKTEKTYRVAITQTHHSYEGRPIIHEYTLDEFSKDPKALLNERKEELAHYTTLPWEHDEHGAAHGGDAHGAKPEHSKAPMAHKPAAYWEDDFRKNGTLYPVYESPGIHWGMSIDLSSCIGCGACVMGCQAENNVSVVGKTHVLKAQEMHWIRIDRYFSGQPEDPDSVQTVFQPMMCQHCDNAPCENVCPVSATNHSSEGLNQMAYNRCIGTKYCANNCPYKVRHFNWMDWNGADCFDDNLYEDYRRDGMNDDLTRMVLNPDVTVRSRGVMEKCSFCVQRLQDAKLTAKKAGRPMKDGEARTACQQACPSDSIVFGNVNDKNSEIYKLRRKNQEERVFYVLEPLHTLPNINYLSKIRNTDEIIAGNEDKDKMMNPIVF